MLQLIVGVVLLVIAVAVLGVVLRWGLKLLGVLIVAVVGLIAGIPLLAGFILEKIFGLLRLRLVTSMFLLLASALIALAVMTGNNPDVQNGGFAAYKYLATPALLLFALVGHRRRVGAQARSEPIKLFRKQDSEFFTGYYATVFLVIAALATESVYPVRDWPPLALACWILATFGQLILLQRESACRKYLADIHDKLSTRRSINASAYLAGLLDEKDYSREAIEAIYCGVLARLLKAGLVDEREIDGKNWVFRRAWHQQQLCAIDEALSAGFMHREEAVHELVGKCLGLPAAERADYAERHLEFSARCEFADADYFVHYRHADRLKKCCGCGVTAERAAADAASGEWFCSDECKKTEQACVAIRQKPLQEVLSETADLGFTVMAGAEAWRNGQKIFAAGGQGHGFAAERANNRIDVLLGKDAAIVGDNNAKDGADRVVAGQQIQTKYYSTGARSVGSAFDGQQGSYRYYDDAGKPMQLEVPKDQVAQAIKTMEKKIAEGKVPGVTDPQEAKNLIRAGHLTYEQARNITKFCTIESLAYDVSEGVIVGLSSGGISFGVTAFVYYLNTKDIKVALRVAVVQFGKTAAKSTTVYVAAQQLHRLEGVQSLLSVVDAELLSPGIRQFLEKGLGVGRGQLSNALRGTIVTSIVVVAVTTGPDLIKLVRGRISGAQFLKNVAVASSGVGGGIVGSVIGGAAGATLGPAGAVAGRLVGGMLGGMASAAVASAIAGTLMEDDRELILRIIRRQVEYLARAFILTAEEIENVAANLEKLVTQRRIEDIHGASNRRAAANAMVKPLVVRVIRQRPALGFNDADVSEACMALAA